MTLEVFVFLIAGLIVVSGALGVVFARHAVHAALFLIQTLFGVAVLFLVVEAHFLAAIQVIVYAGAIMTLFLFVIMLIGVDKAEDRSESIPFQRPITMVLLALFAAGLLVAGSRAWVTGTVSPAEPINGTIEAVGDEIFGTWLLPFEITALLLIIAATGSVALAFFRGGDGEEER